MIVVIFSPFGANWDEQIAGTVHGPLGERRRWYASTNCDTMLEILWQTHVKMHSGEKLPLIATLCRTDLDNGAMCETRSALWSILTESNFVVSKANHELKVCAGNQASLIHALCTEE